MNYLPSEKRYQQMKYKHSGRSGLKLPVISLGLWHNFGGVDTFEIGRSIVQKAFDEGITHFDLANNYGPPPGSAEENFGVILKKDFSGHLRDEMVISTKAGYQMWEGPYGDFGSRKYLLSSLDQSLQRMNLDYVDIFYSHRPDPHTPLEETMGALSSAVKQGKALYVGLSNYPSDLAAKAFTILKENGTPCLIHQPRYSMFDRWVEEDLLGVLQREGVGCIPFSPLAQGLLTQKYLRGIPDGSRAAKPHGFLQKDAISEDRLKTIQELNELALDRGQTLAQMALSWVLRHDAITSVLIGVSSENQLEDNLKILEAPPFSEEELQKIEEILA